MELLEQLHWRYATKKMNPNKTVPQEKVDRILEAVRLAPTSSGLQPYELLVITKESDRSRVRRANHMDYLGLHLAGPDGEHLERRFLGLFASSALTESVLRVPMLRHPKYGHHRRRLAAKVHWGPQKTARPLPPHHRTALQYRCRRAYAAGRFQSGCAVPFPTARGALTA